MMRLVDIAPDYRIACHACRSLVSESVTIPVCLALLLWRSEVVWVVFWEIAREKTRALWGHLGVEAVGIALLFVWYDLAFRMALGPEYSLPIWFLDHPRRDISWLLFLGSSSAVWFIAWVVPRVLAKKGRAAFLAGSEASAARPYARIGFVSAAAMTVGTAFVVFGPASVGFAMVGGVLTGFGFACLVLAAIGGLPGGGGYNSTTGIAVASLSFSCLIRLLVLPLTLTATGVVVCTLPLLSALCLVYAAHGGEGSPKSGSVSSVPVPEASSDAGPTRTIFRDHATTLLACFFGIGVFLGIAGFGSDGFSDEAFLKFNHLTAIAGGIVALLLLLVARRLNPGAAFVLLPVALGTAALLLPFGGNLPVDTVAMSFGKAVNACCFMLAATLVAEPVRPAADRGRALPGLLAGMGVLISVGIMVGGVLMSAVGLDVTALAFVALMLVYLAMLALGLSAQRRAQSSYIIVRNPDDVARIAAAQARAIAQDFPSLSHRELDVLELLLQHQTIDAIAERLNISRNTVKSHIGHLYEKTGLNSRQQLVDLAATKTVRVQA